MGWLSCRERMERGSRFYDHELTKIIDPDWLVPGRDTSEEALGHRTNRGDVMNILRDRLGVNDGTGQVFFQARESGGVPANTWFLRQLKKNARYMNGQKMKRWQASAGVYFPFTPLLNASSNTVYTDADLVKLREARPTLCRSGRDETAAPGGNERPNVSRPCRSSSRTGADWTVRNMGWLSCRGRMERGSRFYDHELTKIIDPGSLNTVRFPEGSVVHVARANRGDVWTYSVTGRASMTGRELFQAGESGGVPANTCFLRQLKKNARYVNGQKMKRWLRAAGADSPLGSWKDLAAANTSGNRVCTDADLVKLREARPTLCRSGRGETAAPGGNEKARRFADLPSIFADRSRLDGQGYGVAFVPREDGNGNRFYDHELTKIIDPDWLKPGPALQEGNVVLRTDRGDVMDILRDSLGVNDGTRQVLFQARESGAPAVVVRGDELGVPDGADIRAYIAAAKTYHDALKDESEHGRPVHNKSPEFADKKIRFSGKGWRKDINAGADKRKWQLSPFLHSILENAEYVRTETTSGRGDEFSRAHWFECEVELGGEKLRSGFTLLEDANGNYFTI